MDLAHRPTKRDAEYDQMRVILNEMAHAWRNGRYERMEELVSQGDRLLTAIWDRRQEEAHRWTAQGS